MYCGLHMFVLIVGCGRGRTRDRFVGETTRYVVEKATCTVILTAPPSGEDMVREGVLP